MSTTLDGELQPDPTAPAIEVDKLHKSFGKLEVLSGIDANTRIYKP